MGGNASPDIAAPTLSVMEFHYIRRHPNTGLCFFRYIDNILAINCLDFLDHAKKIYGTTFTLNTTYSGQYTCFLDLAISCVDGRCIFDVYNKILDYPFLVN
ncbi:unnamed protein product [Gongylonema pulchrum]|uniref:Reverse transcriptase domain-containing protein n=1 Tax=Gongylonema pulchrum TaxID=637853 RepID=A0A183E376_9BILA|nr:unnamed protein product [Gongylonema pulchrum]